MKKDARLITTFNYDSWLYEIALHIDQKVIEKVCTEQVSFALLDDAWEYFSFKYWLA